MVLEQSTHSIWMAMLNATYHNLVEALRVEGVVGDLCMREAGVVTATAGAYVPVALPTWHTYPASPSHAVPMDRGWLLPAL